MAFIKCDFFSEVLGISTSIYVILPQQTRGQIGMAGSTKKEKYPTLYLLHGFSDDHTAWQRRTSIERYVADMGLAVVMPFVGRSFYSDMKYGAAYFTYLSEELPQIVQSFFPLSDKREDTFVAGLSNGGYGAFKLALRCPEKYAAAASLSGGLNVADQALEVDAPWHKDIIYAFGEPSSVKNSVGDLFYLAEQYAKAEGPKPKFYQCCGTEDFLYGDNIKFRDHASALNIDLTYEEGPGTHEWGYWDANIQKVLKWLPIQK